MALQGSITLDNGIVLSSAYLRVLEIVMRYISGDNSADIKVLIFKDSVAYNDSLPEVMEVNHVVNGGDFNTYFSEIVLSEVDKTALTQAYVWLKTLPQYSELTDV